MSLATLKPNANQADSLPGESAGPKTVVDCYDFWDRVFRQGGLQDYTEGYYHGDPSFPYEQAQQDQANYLLDQAECRDGSRILDIGCGNGRLLEAIGKRGAIGVGLTISPAQLKYCISLGLDVRLLNYRHLDADWKGRFDAVIANGSIEHFVQARDAVQGKADTIYHELFEICHRLIDPDSATRRLVNTTINFAFNVDPKNIIRSPWSFRPGSNEYHCALLARGFGGCYPTIGQFERCANPYFTLIEERDATYDYHLTSEAWLNFGKRSLLRPSCWKRLLPFMAQHPLFSPTMLYLLLVSQSWNWQFRTAHPPMKHLWQTWKYNADANYADWEQIPHHSESSGIDRFSRLPELGSA